MQNKPVKKWSAALPLWFGLIALTILIGGVGVWGNFTKISGAIVASGLIQVESFRQVVQHPEGGVVGEISVKDGDVVEAGETLIRFEDKLLKSQITVLEGQLAEVSARKARLKAEQDEATEVKFPSNLLEQAANSPDVAEVLDGQRRLLQARIDTANKEKEQLTERKQQTALQIEGARAQLDSLAKQIEIIEEELEDQTTLLKKGLAQASRVLNLDREKARLLGQVGELESSVARGQAQIIETDINILRLGTQRRENAITELRDVEVREIELVENLFTAQQTLERLDVRAPTAGIVYGMQIYAIRSVVRPADPIMYIIPQDKPFVIQSKVEAIHVDEVYVGQEAALRFSTFDQRTTPEIYGTVANVSADVFQDDVTGVSYYSAEIQPKEGELVRLGEVELLPGMPVEAFIKTRDRTPVSYLMQPFMDYFNRAFRES